MPSPSTVLLRTQSDERLVALAQSGHERAFEAIVERYRKALLRACRRILPEARAEDALQQALMAAWKGLQRGDEVRELRPWLYRIVRNTALNQLRVTGYDLGELVETLSATHDPEEEVMRRAVVRQTLAAVAALPERQREALLRTAIEGRGQDEVARDLGLSDTAVRALVHRARVRVRAAATALVPLPLAASWAAAGAGATGAVATAAKAGTVLALAGGAAATPALLHDRPVDPRRQHAARVDRPRAAPTARPKAKATATPAATPTTVPVVPAATARPVVAVAKVRAPVVVHEAPRGQDEGEDHGGHSGPSQQEHEQEQEQEQEAGTGTGTAARARADRGAVPRPRDRPRGRRRRPPRRRRGPLGPRRRRRPARRRRLDRHAPAPGVSHQVDTSSTPREAPCSAGSSHWP